MTGQVAIPTEDRRHLSKIRYGAISAELNCKSPERRAELGLNPIPEPDEMFDGENKMTRRKKKSSKK